MVHKIIVYYFVLNLDAISNVKLDMMGKKVLYKEKTISLHQHFNSRFKAK